jgi:hypothetical protein
VLRGTRTPHGGGCFRDDTFFARCVANLIGRFKSAWHFHSLNKIESGCGMMRRSAVHVVLDWFAFI